MNMKKQEYLTIPQAAKLLGISRIAVYRKVKTGQIKAHKIGRTYVISRRQIAGSGAKELTAKDKRLITAAVRKTVHDFGEALKILGRE
jgi:excisionase family DNA binding protein